MNSPSNFVRINISMPSDLVTELRRRVPKRQISRFLSDAAKTKIDDLTQEEALKKLLAGSPAFPHIKDSVKWIRELRKGDLKRMKRLGI